MMTKVNPDRDFDAKVGEIIEAFDRQQWYKAKIIAVNWATAEFRIHFFGWNKKHDKTVPFDSDRIRSVTDAEALLKYHIGEKVIAPYYDNYKYPAEIEKVHETTKTYNVKVYF